jgi:hypothetical protein
VPPVAPEESERLLTYTVHPTDDAGSSRVRRGIADPKARLGIVFELN